MRSTPPRRLLAAVIVPAALALTGVAGASVLSAPSDPEPVPLPIADAEPHVQQIDQGRQVGEGPNDQLDDEGVHGGPIERFHDAATCDLVDVSTLPGNWTHGDYVSAVEALGQPELIPIAARSACGKPAHAGGPPDGVGPPDHAGGPPEHAGRPDHAGAPDDAGPPESS